MDSDFKRYFGFVPRHQHSPMVRQVPVRPVRHQETRSPEVVSIPVQFVRSESNQWERNRFDSAVKIQKAFRGFLVRKSVKKIAAVKREVDDIEMRVSRKETMELVRREAKERLKVNEMLMGLLFKLDSVKGVDSGVRDFRRAVIKKAIALQERVDAAVADDEQTLGEVGEASGVDNGEPISETVDGEKAPVDQTLELKSASSEALDETMNLQSLEQTAETGFNIPEKMASNVNENEEIVADESEEEEGAESESRSVSSYNPQNSIEEDAVEIAKAENEAGMGGVGFGERDKEENKRSRELLERMVDDNERMMGMMVELFERNEMQTRMLSSLSQRVEQLERAFLCERLRRRKRKLASADSALQNNARKQ